MLSSSADISMQYKYVVNLHFCIQAKFCRGAFFLALAAKSIQVLRSAFLFSVIPYRPRLAVHTFSLNL